MIYYEMLVAKCCRCDSKESETATHNEDGERICVDCVEDQDFEWNDS
jgi:recombinational DNA repair protein (RecF pathway)